MLPECTVVIAAWNEAECISRKLENTRALRYPAGRLQILVVADGSNDGTADLARTYSGVEVLYQPQRAGKAAAMNRAMLYVQTAIVVFTDANTMLNADALVKLASHYTDPSVGAVSGEKQVRQEVSENAAAAGEGVYWRYESWLKAADSRLYSVAGAAGELFSLRTGLYTPIPSDTLLDDFFLSVQVNIAGYRVAYEPGARATETASASVREEFKRKVRISAGGLQAIQRLWPLIQTATPPLFRFIFVSHRVLRWTLAPAALPAVFVLSWTLAPRASVYLVLAVLQTLFYLLALSGWALETKKVRLKAFFIPFYFTMMNVSVYFGTWRYLRGSQSVLWERAARAS